MQSELDDLLMVYSDLEEKSKQYKVGCVLELPSLLFSCSVPYSFLHRSDSVHSARLSPTPMMMTEMKMKTGMGMMDPRLRRLAMQK